MNKSAIKNFAVRARKNLMSAIEQKAFEVGITRDGIKDIETFEGGFRVNEKVFPALKIEQRNKLIYRIKEKGFDQVIEEVAYTWFNRFIALRFMEINDYLPTGVRVLSSLEFHRAEPDIIREALNIDLNIDRDTVYRYQDQNDAEGLFKYLLIKQCNELANIMPGIFEEIQDYTELLLPDYLLTEGSVIGALVDSIEEEDFKDQVEIIGWLYQYYISEKKDEVFEGLKKNIKITKENIPAATQLFTPDWIVKYMVENSLGRLWLEANPDEELKAKWKYYLEEAEQEPEVQKQLEEIRNKNLNPEEIKVLDPAIGSGHILVYAFDVLYDIYKSVGYSERDIPKLILEKNLFGLDIDNRAGQLAYFALVMKARSKNRRIFRDRIELNVCAIQESNGIPREAIDLLVGDGKIVHRQDVEYLIDVFRDAKEYGSILEVNKVDFRAIEQRVEEIRESHYDDLFVCRYRDIILEKLPALIKQARVMSEKYNVVCTNPPYMGNGGMNARLSAYVQKNYPYSKSDLFAVFIERCKQMVKSYGFQAMVTQHAWMFLSSYEKLRQKLMLKDIINMAHLGARAFEEIGGEVVQTTSFVFRNSNIKNYNATYVRLVEYDNQQLKELGFLNGENRYVAQKEPFSKIPGMPVAYWVSNKVYSLYKNPLIRTKFTAKEGIGTRNDDVFLKLFWEVQNKKIGIGNKWILTDKAGQNKKWFMGMHYVMDWENDGYRIKNYRNKDGSLRSRPQNISYLFKSGISWGKVGSGATAFRWRPDGFGFNDAAPTLFGSKVYELLGILNSKVFKMLLQIRGLTLNVTCGVIEELPLIGYETKYSDQINKIITDNISISRTEWDSFETSWDFKCHPFLNREINLMFLDLETGLPRKTIESAFEIWKYFTEKQFQQLKANEEELNRIFIDIYGLQDELTPEVDDKDITISKADRDRDIRFFISYAVGCMFGRYSLDEEWLIYAGGQFDPQRYKTFQPCADNVLPIADDVYFDEDIVSRFVDFVRISFGEETLEENLDFIAETLNKKPGETSRKAIRRYFLNDFYKDHVKVYKKRPIYWLFESGRQNGFKALIYLHRYDPYTVARVRTDYLHKLQKKYDAEINRLDIVLESNVSQAEKAKVRKKKEDLIKKMQECLVYDQAIAHVANQKIELDLDDGVVVNYAKFQGIEIPQGEGKKPLKADLLAKI